MVTTKQMYTLDKLVKKMNTIRFSDLPSQFHQTNTKHVTDMVKQAKPFIQNHKLDIIIDPWHTDAIIKAHDLPEMGLKTDFTVIQVKDNPSLAHDKHNHEINMINKLRNQYGTWIENLWLEYSNQETNNSKFVKWLDKYNATKHIIDVHGGQRFKDLNWFVNCTNHIIKSTKSKFLVPPTLQILEDRKPLFKKHGLLSIYNEKENELTQFLDS